MQLSLSAGKGKEHKVFIEVWGNSLSWFSLNYQRSFYQSDARAFQSAVRIGIGFRDAGYAIPLSYSIFIGKQHLFELGIGYSFVKEKITSYYVTDIELHHIGLARIGYQMELKKLPVFFNIAFTPLHQSYIVVQTYFLLE